MCSGGSFGCFSSFGTSRSQFALLAKLIRLFSFGSFTIPKYVSTLEIFDPSAESN
jgi:hypothetical protein